MIYLTRDSYPEYMKNSYDSASEKQTTNLKNEQRTWLNIFPKTDGWPTDRWKYAQYHQSSGKWDTNEIPHTVRMAILKKTTNKK